MNAIVISAVLGVVMMFCGVFTNSKSAVRIVAIIGLLGLVIANVLDMGGYHFFNVNVKGMLAFDTFGLLFNTIAFASTWMYFLLSGRDMERVGTNLAEYFALI